MRRYLRSKSLVVAATVVAAVTAVAAAISLVSGGSRTPGVVVSGCGEFGQGGQPGSGDDVG